LDPEGLNLARRSQCCQKSTKSFEKFEDKKKIAASFLPGRLKKSADRQKQGYLTAGKF
jgi:hypothetical protein